jgi:hypothetical protein
MCESDAESVLLRARIAELERELTAAGESRNRLRLALQDVRGLCRCGPDEGRMRAALAAIVAHCDTVLGEG